MASRSARLVLPVALLVLPVAACGGGDEGADTAAADTAAVAAPATAAAGADTASTLSESDLATYERALAAEVALLREAVAKKQSAKTSEDTLAAMMAATDMQSMPAAAERAGMDADRYRRLDDAFGTALGARRLNPGMQAMMSQMDTSHLASLPADQAEQQRAQLRANMAEMQAAFSDSAAYRTVPPALRDAFKARAEATLDSLWRERFELRVRAAGIGG